MMNRFLIFLLIFLCQFSYGQESSIYKKEKEFGKLTLTVKEIKKMVSTIEYYYKENPVDTINRYNHFTISCEISRKNESQTYQGFQQIQAIDLENLTYTSTQLEYAFSNQRISSVNVLFSENYRKITITGTDKVKVDALFNALNEQVSTHEETLAFINWEFVITVLLSFLFLGALLFLTGAKVNNPGAEVQRLLNQIKIGCGIYILLCFLFFISPYRIKDLFPGFELLSENIKWYDKYANLISVVLVFIGMIGTAYRYLTKLFLLVPINAKPEGAAEKNSDSIPTLEE